MTMPLKSRLFIAAIVVILSMVSAGHAAQRVRIGAVCNDGTESTATGSGACSHHHGVKCWNYNDGTCTKP